MEAKFKGIDFEAFPEIKPEILALLREHAGKTLGITLSPEQLEVLTLCVSKRFAGNLKNIKEELNETFGVN